MKNAHKTHLLFTGGGTLGPVKPLFTIADEWKTQDPQLIISWIGTPNGPEGELIRLRGESFYALSAPKLSRHTPWLWPIIPFHFLASLAKAWFFLKHIKPDMVFSAGAFVSVPVALAAYFLRIPVWIHQLDVVPGLANRLMAPFAKRISATWILSADRFPKRKTMTVGGLGKREEKGDDRKTFLTSLGLSPDLPLLFVFGGGTGATQINEAMEVVGPHLVKRMQVIHLTGIGKMRPSLERIGERYVAREFFSSEMDQAFHAADLVVSRAGMGTILGVIRHKKPAILLPIEGSHQEANAKVMEERGAAEVIYKMTPQILKQKIEHLMRDENARKQLALAASRAISLEADKKIVEEARKILENK